MSLIQWDFTYSVEIRIIDEQHHKLFDILNTLHTAMKTGKGKVVLADTITQLKDYVRIHFTTEEDLMRKYNYPKSTDHKIQHDKFIEKILDTEIEYKEGKIALTMPVLNFLMDWLLKHVKGADKELGQFLKSRGVV